MLPNIKLTPTNNPVWPNFQISTSSNPQILPPLRFPFLEKGFHPLLRCFVAELLSEFAGFQFRGLCEVHANPVSYHLFCNRCGLEAIAGNLCCQFHYFFHQHFRFGECPLPENAHIVGCRLVFPRPN